MTSDLFVIFLTIGQINLWYKCGVERNNRSPCKLYINLKPRVDSGLLFFTVTLDLEAKFWRNEVTLDLEGKLSYKIWLHISDFLYVQASFTIHHWSDQNHGEAEACTNKIPIYVNMQLKFNTSGGESITTSEEKILVGSINKRNIIEKT